MGFGEIAAMAGGHAEARAIQVALKLGLFEALSRGQLDEASLARAIKTDARATGLLANALAALGCLKKATVTSRSPTRRAAIYCATPANTWAA